MALTLAMQNFLADIAKKRIGYPLLAMPANDNAIAKTPCKRNLRRLCKHRRGDVTSNWLNTEISVNRRLSPYSASQMRKRWPCTEPHLPLCSSVTWSSSRDPETNRLRPMEPLMPRRYVQLIQQKKKENMRVWLWRFACWYATDVTDKQIGWLTTT